MTVDAERQCAEDGIEWRTMVKRLKLTQPHCLVPACVILYFDCLPPCEWAKSNYKCSEEKLQNERNYCMKTSNPHLENGLRGGRA